ncbi:hypothetical protein V6N13_140472 [Hibiscus sabdariffa]|uniref:Uncharacterized protein n=2 Tax=Hibiscus sabdariffa TaxID=183260 RepID=A0ABR2QAG3_9ROSI
MVPPLIAPIKDADSGINQVVAELMGDSSSAGQQVSADTVVDPVILAQIHKGLSTGFDIVMAHDEEETLGPTSDGLKRPRISSSAPKVSLNDSTGTSTVISAGLAQRASRKQ